MTGEKNIAVLLQTMKPALQEGDYVFCTVANIDQINLSDIIFLFREAEGYTVVLAKELAEGLQLPYTYVAAWITLTVHSSLEAVGLTAAFATALANENISCNVVAGYYHDHLFVDKKDADKAMDVLHRLSAGA
ncbi:MAG: ACT domain-containing protein [Bacteroidetes bacterium]|nr:ACT domain-containing protein [Bacteroidota bacterium]